MAQRAVFQEAERALLLRQPTRYRRLKASLEDYPLYPYLEYRELRGRLASLDDREVRRFLTDYGDSPLAGQLRDAWLTDLAAKGRWQRYLDFYGLDDEVDVAQQCRYLHALIKTGKSTEALSRVEPIWLHGSSRPRACDPVFDRWRAAGRLTQPLVWQRIELAMSEGERRLARYLGRFLEAKERPWLERWLRLYRKPALVLKESAFEASHPYRETLLLYGIRRMAREDAGAALDAWRKVSLRYPFDREQEAEAERSLAVALVRERHPYAEVFVEKMRTAEDDPALLEAGIRAALADRNWSRALLWLEALPERKRRSERWTYWQARALEALGYVTEAEAFYRTVAAERSYYGFLAADKLDNGYKLDAVPLQIDDSAMERLLDTYPGLARARELHALERLVPARREWEAVVQGLSHDELRVAAKLAQQWHWHDRAIFSLARTAYWDDLELRFPLKYRDQIEIQARGQQLDSAWIFAVLRQESAFVTDARSHSGALGLMQLMPRTARFVARRSKLRSPRKSDLIKPDVNIRFGAAYMRRVLDELDQHPVLATAAYNAGPRRVKSWLPERETPADIWIETVPFKETRTYLRRVLAYTVIYEQRLGLPTVRLRERMQPVGGPELRTSALGRDGEDRG